jgi:hypothetical protein
MILLHCVAFYTPRNEAAGEALTKFQRTKKTRSVDEKWPFLIEMGATQPVKHLIRVAARRSKPTSPTRRSPLRPMHWRCHAMPAC